MYMNRHLNLYHHVEPKLRYSKGRHTLGPLLEVNFVLINIGKNDKYTPELS